MAEQEPQNLIPASPVTPETGGSLETKLSPAEKQYALEWLKVAAERGVVVERKGKQEASDLDGNISIYLLRKAGVIGDKTKIYYVLHEDLPKFMKQNPNVGIMIDISEEENPVGAGAMLTRSEVDSNNPDRQIITESGLPYRDSLISIIADAAGNQIPGPNRGRVYFEHHGEKSNPDKALDPNYGCSAMKVYDWLIKLGALPEPDPTKTAAEDEGQGLKNIVEFVDAQDNKNYYSTALFDIEQTLTNAFGLIQARPIDGSGKPIEKEWLGKYDVRARSYYWGFMELMATTGGDYTKQFSPEELEKIGISNATKVIERVRQGIEECRKIISDLRTEGKRIQKTKSGGEVFIDMRPPKTDGLLDKKGVDPTDMLMSEGIRSRIIMGVDANGGVEEMTVFFHNDPAVEEMAKKWHQTRGGQILRNSMYVYTKARGANNHG